ncbi:lipid-binding SYLF domain-containing protein [Chachezhania sediminis]|uniref:lipid-binding SYLF domain-containing protein n=1 Tax=Chachezhania sediminis TaxID=2599291 RepID=UPI00131B595B|nr:YSC84-related protein [Chachezhania sediminis]
MSRRFALFAPAALAGLSLVSACGNGVGNSAAATIDARADATLAEMYSKYPNTRILAQKSSGMLVMPLVTEAGFGLGGGYGRGVLRVDGVTVDYYSAIKGSAGFQIGAQQYAHVLFFMTPAALSNFRRSSGWTVGADAEYVLADKGDGVKADSATLNTPVLVAIFGRAGLLVGATLEGTKYTRIIP